MRTGLLPCIFRNAGRFRKNAGKRDARARQKASFYNEMAAFSLTQEQGNKFRKAGSTISESNETVPAASIFFLEGLRNSLCAGIPRREAADG